MTIEELALAYELRQEGCCWKRIATGLGCDPVKLGNQVTHLMRHGIGKGLDGYARTAGHPANFNIETIKAANRRRRDGCTWRSIGLEFSVDGERLRKSHRYAVKRGLI